MMFLLLLAAAMPPRDVPKPAAPPAAPAQIEGLPIDVLPKQELPATGCAAFLWTATETRTLVAMAAAEPAHLRLAIDGAIVDLPRAGMSGAQSFGLAESADYAAPGIRATLDLKIETRGDLVKGGVVPQGSLRVDRDGKDGVVLPVTGLIGCAG